MDHCIVYFSTWQEPFRQDDLSATLEQSRLNNNESGITGIMLFVKGSVVQVLEGAKDVIEALYQRIEADQRHTDVIRVLNRPIQKRLFGQWAMGYETITERQLDQIRMVVDLNDQQKPTPKLKDDPILRTIQVFYDSNRYN